MAQIKPAFRREDRLDVTIPARCRTRSGFADRLMIRDLSSRGCRVDSLANTLHAGDLVVVTPSMLEGQCGTVRWVSGNEAGIEFATPLYGPVVDHLHRQFRTFLPEGRVYSSPAARMAA